MATILWWFATYNNTLKVTLLWVHSNIISLNMLENVKRFCRLYLSATEGHVLPLAWTHRLGPVPPTYRSSSDMTSCVCACELWLWGEAVRKGGRLWTTAILSLSLSFPLFSPLSSFLSSPLFTPRTPSDSRIKQTSRLMVGPSKPPQLNGSTMLNWALDEFSI